MCSARWRRDSSRGAPEARSRASRVVEVVAFAFAMFTVYGCGPEPVLYGLVLLLLGIPFYVWLKRENTAAGDTQRTAVQQAH